MWFPVWPLGRPDAPPVRTFVVAGGRVVAVSADLSDVRPGMARREAEGLSPGATVLVRDLAEEALRFEPVVAAVSDAVPAVEVVEPGLLLVPLAGAVRYYGSEERVVGEIVGRLSHDGWRIGVADGPFAATWRRGRPGPGPRSSSMTPLGSSPLSTWRRSGWKSSSPPSAGSG